MKILRGHPERCKTNEDIIIKPVESGDSSVSSSGVRAEKAPVLPEPELPKTEGQIQYEKI